MITPGLLYIRLFPRWGHPSLVQRTQRFLLLENQNQNHQPSIVPPSQEIQEMPAPIAAFISSFLGPSQHTPPLCPRFREMALAARPTPSPLLVIHQRSLILLLRRILAHLPQTSLPWTFPSCPLPFPSYVSSCLLGSQLLLSADLRDLGQGHFSSPSILPALLSS